MTTQPKIITGRSSGSVLYDELITKLNTLTGCEWGFVKTKNTIYITSGRLAVTVGAPKWNNPAAKPNTDIVVENFDHRQQHWDDIVMTEIRTKLIAVLKSKKIVPSAEIITAIKSWSPTQEYEIMSRYIKEQVGCFLPAVTIYDTWLDACLEAKVGVSNVT